jgi:hypothetical protein
VGKLWRKGGKTETKDYGVLVFATSLEEGKLRFHDTITLAASFGGTVFGPKIAVSHKQLAATGRGHPGHRNTGQKARQLTFTNGQATIIEFSGATNKQKWTFPDGILSFNALLRLAPLLPRDAGTVYTFRAYAEPVLFRVREAKAPEVFSLTCDGSEKVTVEGKALECVRFRLELKSASIRTDVWVGGANNSVVKFRDTMPQGAGASFLDATLQE